MADNRVLASVNGANITEQDVTDAIVAMGQRGQGLNNPQGRGMVLEQLINRKLLLASASRDLLEFDPEFKAQLKALKEELLTKLAYSLESRLAEGPIHTVDIFDSFFVIHSLYRRFVVSCFRQNRIYLVNERLVF